MKRVCVFDVNETLLDLSALDAPFALAFGDAAVRREWFGQFIQNALVSTVAGRYRTFGEIGRGALQMIAARRGVSLSDVDVARITGGLTSLPAHPDARPALERLKAEGFRLASLTNSTLEVARVQLRNAGLAELFEHVLSADEVKRLKPAPEPYRMAAERFEVETSGIRLIAAHAWDVSGALAAGCAAAFVSRGGAVPEPLGDQPDVVGNDLLEVAERISALER